MNMATNTAKLNSIKASSINVSNLVDHLLALDDLRNCDIGLISSRHDNLLDAAVITDRSPKLSVHFHFLSPLLVTGTQHSGIFLGRSVLDPFVSRLS